MLCFNAENHCSELEHITKLLLYLSDDSGSEYNLHVSTMRLMSLATLPSLCQVQMFPSSSFN